LQRGAADALAADLWLTSLFGAALLREAVFVVVVVVVTHLPRLG
jgi:hypothetical protein